MARKSARLAQIQTAKANAEASKDKPKESPFMSPPPSRKGQLVEEIATDAWDSRTLHKRKTLATQFWTTRANEVHDVLGEWI
jgi:hypothetical protein